MLYLTTGVNDMSKTRYHELEEIIKMDEEEFENSKMIIETFKRQLQQYLSCHDKELRVEYSYYKKEIYYFNFLVHIFDYAPIEFSIGTNESRYLFYSENDIEYFLDDEETICDLKDAIFTYLKKEARLMLKKN